VHDVGAERPQHAFGPGQHLGVPADERQQRALAGPVVAAAQRGVQQPAPGAAGDVVQPAHLVGVDRRADQDVAGPPHRSQRTVLADEDVADHPATGGDQDDVAPGRVLHRGRTGDPRRDLRRGIGVVPDDLVARRDEVAGHRAAHAAQAEDGHRRFSGFGHMVRLSDPVPQWAA
jgi:hypothetical protein